MPLSMSPFDAILPLISYLTGNAGGKGDVSPYLVEDGWREHGHTEEIV
jgi:hypothetical protein